MTAEQKKLLIQVVEEQVWETEQLMKEEPELLGELIELKAILEELRA